MMNDEGMVWEIPALGNSTTEPTGIAAANTLEAATHPDEQANRLGSYINEGYLQSMLAALGPAPAEDDIEAHLIAVKNRSADMTPIWDDSDLDIAISDAAERLADIHSHSDDVAGRHRRAREGNTDRAGKIYDLADLSPGMSPGAREIIEQCIGTVHTDPR